ncbi:MAG TPA: zinc-binding alcohol dehydrogenase [Bradyrhizobium sp.]|nr:zinc-binding alcohol dehydrogenase [Bradyrhizobium sp.]
MRIEFIDFEIADLEPFEFLGPRPVDVRVDAQFSTISPGTERAVLCGMPGARRPFPYTPGYSTAGVVTEAGAKSGFAIGDRVAGRMSHSSSGLLTPASMFRVPDGVDMLEASYIELGIICLQGIRKSGIRPGERVAVIGQGLIGQMATRLARLAGADPLIAVASSRRRASSAVGPGRADQFVSLADDPGALARIEADVVIEAVGSSLAIAQATTAARRGGRVILLGSSRDLGRNLDWHNIVQERDITLIGAHIGALPTYDASPGRWTYAQEGRLFLAQLASGLVHVADMTSWKAAPADCNRVYEVVAEGGREHVGIVFDWTR